MSHVYRTPTLAERFDAVVIDHGFEARVRLDRASTLDEAQNCARRMGIAPVAFERSVDGYVVGRCQPSAGPELQRHCQGNF